MTKPENTNMRTPPATGSVGLLDADDAGHIARKRTYTGASQAAANSQPGWLPGRGDAARHSGPAARDSRLAKIVRMWLVAGILILAVGLAGCGGSSAGGGGTGSAGTTQHVHFAKTKFLLHAGLAFGAFHRYIYKPFRNGGFTSPLKHKLAIVKAGAAALFAYHEIKIALVDAQSSPLLSKLVSPLTALRTRLSSLGQHLHSGQLNPSAINGANGAVTNIGSLGASSGASIRDLATPTLGG